MSVAVLEKRRAERDQARAAALAIAESDTFDPEDENYRELAARAEALDTSVASLAALLDKQAAADQLDGRLSKSLAARAEKSPEALQTRQSAGELFVRSELFKDYAASPRGRSGAFEFDTLPLQTRALPTGVADLIAAGLTGGKHQVDITKPQAPTPLLNAVTTIQVSTNAVEFVAWSKVAGGAAIVPEKGAKPSAEWGPAVTSDTLDNIAVHTQLTRQMIEDFPAVRSYIDDQLSFEVLAKEEAEAAAAINAAVLPATTGADLSTAIRNGMVLVELAGFTADAVLINPADAADLEVAARGANFASDPYWGLTPIKAASIPEGSPIVGDFRRAVERYVRSQVQLFITDSHADTFLTNVFTLLAERRSLTAVVRPQALAEVTVGV